MIVRRHHVALILLVAWLIVYQTGPAWQHLLIRLGEADTAPTRALALIRNLVSPLFCITLGIGIAALRSVDRRAWLLLAFLLSFAETSREMADFSRRDDWLRLPAFWYNEVAEGSWAIWMFLFAIYFPDRLPFDRRSPWLKSVLIAPIAAIVVVTPLQKLHVPGAYALLSSLGPIVPLLAFSFTGGVLLLLGHRYWRTTDADDRRRLRLLYWGSVVGLGPSLALSLIRTFAGAPALARVPQPLVIVAEVMTVVLPLTLAYVVLVYRALDVRIVVREGLLLAFAAHILAALRGTALLVAAVALPLASGERQEAPTLWWIAWLLVVALLLQPNLAGVLTGWLDRRFFQRENEREAALYGLIDSRWNASTAPQLAKDAAAGLKQALQLSRMTFFVRDVDGFVAADDLTTEGPFAGRVDAAVILDLCRARRQARVYADDPTSWLRGASPSGQELLRTLQTRLLVPCVQESTVLGVLSVGPDARDRVFSASEVRLVERLSSRLAIALEHCELMQHLRQEVAEHEKVKGERHAAEAASQAKSNFIAHMSHELRTPLNAILGYTEMLRESADESADPGLTADLDRIRTAARHLLTLINSVLDLSKIEAGKMSVYWERVDVAGAVDDAVSLVRPVIEQNDNQLMALVEPGLGVIDADAVKLRQILVNLLGNAGKFTRNGVVTLSVRQTGEDGCGAVQFEIADTGVGMTREQVSRLFRPFEQTGASISRQYGGTGLGLALSRRLCELMNARISVRSTPGTGSTFTVTLPRAADASPGNGSSVAVPAAAL